MESSEILELINSFGVRKARGYDEISIRTIKENKLSLVPVLTHLINLTIKSSEFPDCLKIARVTPLFKKGDVSDPNNYRPISILPALSKIVEKVLSIQIQNYLDSNNIITQFQYGFRKGKSTTDAISTLLEKLYKNFDEGSVMQWSIFRLF